MVNSQENTVKESQTKTASTKKSDKKMFIKTYGCQMNFYDSEKMGDLMTAEGFSNSDKPDDSDLVILNTCHIREKASEKMYSELGRIRKMKDKRQKEGKNTVIAVAGCVAQAEGSQIKERAPFVDVVVGPQSFQRLPELVQNAENGAKRGIELDFATNDKFDFLNEEVEKRGLSKSEEFSPSAFVTVQEGCDKFCTFCVVPYTRGAEVSRGAEVIYRESLMLASKGVKEIVLLGQNVNAYHGKDSSKNEIGLGKLMEKLAKIDGIERIRYSTSHPRDVDEKLINAHRDIEKVMPFLHLPVQSGSDRILAAMNRKHTSDEYRRIIDKFRKAQPGIEFSSDFIVGYPDETEQDFKDSMKLIEDVGFSLSYSFIYSARPGTKAAAMEDNTPKQVKKERLMEMQALLEKQMKQSATEKIETKTKVLINKKGKFEGQVQGFTPQMQPVVLKNANEFMNKIVDVKIEKLKDRALFGKII